jgi:hypothetical protein
VWLGLYWSCRDETRLTPIGYHEIGIQLKWTFGVFEWRMPRLRSKDAEIILDEEKCHTGTDPYPAISALGRSEWW